ncbi:hypothetical protein XAP412_410020 [Xanthomonas phaseoli pv. phaseoli]|uniref:Uncharacterized protein n=1 Tax=Xanthomonas campestris pv. phaseoli TaxID=317013 RepID=A0AB38E0N6_XANCH|nr:hypothetical protein XAP6984_460019 [Xanthomonas phaseoli pv. phaseoli]SON85189.1 hypothetical protein XAP412_410020 [Xanthomonas phaseoli pv. phaseoli]SON89699.1 hypothetical protein XAP7430_430019 [Xanthomonas phaseoli pv. phaseoli]SOO27921.1 hypothetical protein XAP6164_2000007 [Xanthomonas phaseoli pv. phaseoli]
MERLLSDPARLQLAIGYRTTAQRLNLRRLYAHHPCLYGQHTPRAQTLCAATFGCAALCEQRLGRSGLHRRQRQ